MTATTTARGVKYLNANGANQFVEMEVGGGRHEIALSVGGSFAATVTLQRKRPDQDDADYKDAFSTTSAAEKIITVFGPMVVRAGIKTGDFSTGTAEIELSGG